MELAYPREAAAPLHDRLTERVAAVFATMNGSSNEEIESARQFSNRIAPIPSVSDLEYLLDIAFFASLTQEEGRPVCFSLAYCDPTYTLDSKTPAVRFATELPLAVEHIRKLSPASNPETTDIAVFPSGNKLTIWGLVYARSLPPGTTSKLLGLAVATRQVGVLIVRFNHEHVLTFANGQITFADTNAFNSESILRFLMRAFQANRPSYAKYFSATTIIDMACVALEGGVGATVLVLPQGLTARALEPAKYGVHESARATLAAALADPGQFELARSVAHLASIDGALVVDEFGMLLGAGTMIRTEETPDFSVVIVNPQSPTEPPKHGALSSFSAGARHRSGLVFCYLNPGAVALVVSHDGVMSLLTRPVEEEKVLAVRPFRRGAPIGGRGPYEPSYEEV